MANKSKKINEATMKQVDWRDEGKSDIYEGHWVANNVWCEKLYDGKPQEKTNVWSNQKPNDG